MPLQQSISDSPIVRAKETAIPAEIQPKSKLSEWLVILSAYISGQAGVQIVNLCAGLLLVNFMAVREYALYTLALSAFSFMTIVTDLGIGNALVYFRRESAVVRSGYTSYIRSAFQLRTILFAITVSGLLILFPFFAYHRGFHSFEIFIAAGAISLASWFQIRASLQLMLIRLDGQYGKSYVAEMAGSAARLLLSVAMLAITLLHGYVMVVVNAIGSIVTARMSWIEIGRGVQTHEESKDILRYLLPTLPNVLYFSIQGPLVIWLCAYFGRAENIAQVGALGRLALLMGLVTNFIGMVVIPRLAAVTDERWYLKRYLQYWIPVLLIAVTIAALGLGLPGLFLILLGKHYQGLENEVGLVAISVSLKLCETYILAINSARGWNRWQVGALLLYAISQLVLIAVLDLSTTSGVIRFGLFSNLAGLIFQIPINIAGFVKPAWVKVETRLGSGLSADIK